MKDEKEEELISTDSDAHGTQYIGRVSGNLQSAMANAYPFTISPQELTNIVNKYKEKGQSTVPVEPVRKPEQKDSSATNINKIRQDYPEPIKTGDSAYPVIYIAAACAFSGIVLLILVAAGRSNQYDK